MFTALVFSTLLAAFAGGPGGPQGERGGGDELNAGKLMMILKTVDLTPDQWKQIHQLLHANRQQIAPLRQQVRQLREQIADKLTGTAAVQASDIAPLRQQIRTTQESIDDQLLSVVLQIRGIMTPQELAQMAASHGKFKQLRSEYEAIMKGNSD